MVNFITIYGERCSGTNYLQNLIELNFTQPIIWEYGNKHFFGFNDLNNTDDTLFICIVRNSTSWLNSLYHTPHHLVNNLRHNRTNFLNNEFCSFDDNDGNTDESIELPNDRNIYTKNRYKNVFELRYTKLKFMIEDLPHKVKHTLIIRYEDLLDDFESTMNKLKDYGNLTIRESVYFPLNNTSYDVKYLKPYVKNKYTTFSEDDINTHPDYNTYYEHKLLYN